jgi:SAM-dependent methyltransferase
MAADEERADRAARGWGPPGIVLVCSGCGARLPPGTPCARCGIGNLDGEGFLRCLPAAGCGDPLVQGFYEAHPFPDYDDLDSPRVLRERARASRFARLLDEQLPLRGLTLDAGCGTGQLANFLALSSRHVIGLDCSRASLTLACRFRRRFSIACAHFVQGDLARPPFADGSFATIVSLGVLHHTPAPEAALQALVPLLQPGGHLVLGLYNCFARLRTSVRGVLVRAAGAPLAALDPIVRRRRGQDRRRRAWIADQYHHPRASQHTVGEVLRWFDRAGLAYTSAMPPIRAGEHEPDEPRLFASGARGGAVDHLLCQLGWMFTQCSAEGGLFVLIARRP